MRGLYIHIPFCISKCAYCDFYSLPKRLDSLGSYVDALVQEAGSYAGMSFQTLFIGGGTPSLLGVVHLKNLIDGIGKLLDISGLVEGTVEVNPESASREFLEAARDNGINRISFGVQSLNDNELRSVGRIHTAVQAVKAIKLAKSLRFKSISADLIIGLPGQTWTTLRRSMETLINLGIGHLSVYCLSLEEGTLLVENPPDNLVSDDRQAELFEKMVELLNKHGFIHYEISNFALEDYECRHNLNYWHGGEYLGIGAAAASHLNGRRFKNRADMDAYIQAPTAQVEYTEELGEKEKAAEEAMLRLRLLQEGLNLNELSTRFGCDIINNLKNRLDCMVDEGLLIFENSCYRLTPSRILTSNPIFARVISE